MTISKESFYRWKQDAVTIAYKVELHKLIEIINSDLLDGNGLFDGDYSLKSAFLFGQRSILLQLLELNIDDFIKSDEDIENDNTENF